MLIVTESGYQVFELVIDMFSIFVWVPVVYFLGLSAAKYTCSIYNIWRLHAGLL